MEVVQERINFRLEEFVYRTGREPVGIIIHPRMWYELSKEYYSERQFIGDTSTFQGIKLFRTTDVNETEVKIF